MPAACAPYVPPVASAACLLLLREALACWLFTDLPPYLLLMLAWGENKPETSVAVAVAWPVPVAKS
jgi:hypothetical protein